MRQSLWATHDAVNAATKFYEQRLLLMRGESYFTADGEVGEAAVLDELRKIIGDIDGRQQRHGEADRHAEQYHHHQDREKRESCHRRRSGRICGPAGSVAGA